MGDSSVPIRMRYLLPFLAGRIATRLGLNSHLHQACPRLQALPLDADVLNIMHVTWHPGFRCQICRSLYAVSQWVSIA